MCDKPPLSPPPPLHHVFVGVQQRGRRERGRESVCENARVRKGEHVCVCVGVCMRVNVCVCVCERERERESENQIEVEEQELFCKRDVRYVQVPHRSIATHYTTLQHTATYCNAH